MYGRPLRAAPRGWRPLPPRSRVKTAAGEVLQSAPAGAASASAALTTAIALAAASASAALAAASLTTGTGFVAAPFGRATATANLSTFASLQAQPKAVATATANLIPDPSWNATPADRVFTQGTADSQSFLPYLDNFDAARHQIQVLSGTLPSNVTLDPTFGLVHSSAAGTSSPVSMRYHVADLAIGAAADFAARSVGAYHAQDFSAFTTAADVYNNYNVGQMVGHLCSSSKFPAAGTFWTNSFEIVTTAGHAASGKAFRLWQGKNNYGASGDIDNQWFCIPANGNGNNLAGAFHTKMYVQFAVWMDSIIDYFWHDAGVDSMPFGGMKVAILDTYHGSPTTGEFVITNDLNRGFVTAYRDNPSSAPIIRSQATPSNNSNFAVNNAIDNGAGVNDGTEAGYHRRWGPMVYGMTGGTSQGALLHTQGVPDPAAASATVPWQRAGITVIEMEVDMPNDRMRYWAAAYGQAPKLIGDTSLDNQAGNTAGMGSRVYSDGVGYNSLLLTNLIYQAYGQFNPNYPTDAYIDYSEIIFHPNPINFPGNFRPPGT